MEEQNNQNLEEQKIEQPESEEGKEQVSAPITPKKPFPKMVIGIVAAVATVGVVLAIALGGGNNNPDANNNQNEGSPEDNSNDWVTDIPEGYSSKGLEYTLNDDEASYSVEGIGTCADTDIVIPFKYNNLPVTSIGEGAFRNCTSLTSVTIPASVTSIGDYAFYGCKGLTSVTIPNSVTSIGSYAFSGTAYYNDESNWEDGVLYIGNHLIGAKNTISGNYAIKVGTVTIADYAFSRCTSLTSITIPDSVMSIGYQAFGYCTSLTSVTIPDSVTSIGSYAFSGTAYYNDESNWEDGVLYIGNHLIEAKNTISGNYAIKVETVTIASVAFEGCTSLTSITIPDSVTSIGIWAFCNCTSLTSIEVDENNQYYKSIDGNLYNKDGTTLIQYAIGKQDASFTIPDSVTSIGEDAFNNCRSLTSVTIPDSVTSIGKWAFSYCTSLTSVTIPNSVTSIGEGAFNGCRSLTSITIPDSVTSIGIWAFSGCESLTSVTIPASVTSIGGAAFWNCTSLTSVTIPDSVTSIGAQAFSGTAYYNDESNWEDGVLYIGNHLINAKNTISGNYAIKVGTVTIADYAFFYCTSLTSMTIPDSVTSIGEDAFYNCTSLTSITIPDSVTSIGSGAFWNCTSLTSIDVDENNQYYKSIDGNLYNKDGTTLIQYAIGKQDTSFTIPDSVTSIGRYAFDDCTSLTSVTIGNSVTSIGKRAFSCCTSLTSITIPDSVTSIGGSAFWNCTSLTSVTIPDSVTSIGDYAFYGCKGLTSVTIPDSVTSIGDDAFYNCTSLESITIPDSVTSIGSEAFRSCSSLTSVTIGDSVTSIGSEAFSDCTSLTSITFEGTIEQWSAINKGSRWNYNVSATEVICSDGTVTL